MAVSILSGKLADLLKQASPRGDMHVTILSSTRLGIGINPSHPQTVIDLVSDTMEPFSTHTIQLPGQIPPPGVIARRTRRTGAYPLHFNGKTSSYSSLKELLGAGLKEIEAYVPGTLDKLRKHKAPTKRIVARAPKDLFDQTELAEKYAEPLIDGWCYGTNNSAEETKTWLRRACEYAGLEWDKDFRVEL